MTNETQTGFEPVEKHGPNRALRIIQDFNQRHGFLPVRIELPAESLFEQLQEAQSVTPEE